MARVIWTGSAQRDLQEIAEYISLDNPDAARRVVARIERHVAKLNRFPELGPVVPDVIGSIRQIVEAPCRVFYKIDGKTVYIMHVLRFERLLRLSRLEDQD